ncbi:MAG: biotin operon repressor [Cellulosilyticaceae bacterium]
MTKEEVLKVFESHKGEIISGIDLADELGISRTAIWKAISSLRDEGYDIESIKKKGYRLNINSDILSALKIQSSLREKIYDLRVYKTTDSTNRQARIALATEDKEWLVIASEMQENGVGQGQSQFASPQGKGVYMSVVLKPAIDFTAKEVWLKAIKKSIVQGILEVSGVQVDIVQDYHLKYEDIKLGGILSELIIGGESNQIEAAIIGIGIYIYEDHTYLKDREEMKIGCLSDITGKYCNRSELIASILNRMYTVEKREHSK